MLIIIIKISSVCHSRAVFQSAYLALEELETLLIENLNKFRLKVLVTVPGSPSHGAVRLQVVQHVNLLL